MGVSRQLAHRGSACCHLSSGFSRVVVATQPGCASAPPKAISGPSPAALPRWCNLTAQRAHAHAFAPYTAHTHSTRQHASLRPPKPSWQQILGRHGRAHDEDWRQRRLHLPAAGRGRPLGALPPPSGPGTRQIANIAHSQQRSRELFSWVRAQSLPDRQPCSSRKLCWPPHTADQHAAALRGAPAAGSPRAERRCRAAQQSGRAQVIQPPTSTDA